METTNDLQEEFKRIISKNRLLIKFGNKKNLESLQNGCIYMKNLKYYASLEDDGSGVPDNQEGMFVMDNIDFELRDIKTKDVVARGVAKKGKLDFGIMKSPIFCLYNMDVRNLRDINVDMDAHEISGDLCFSDVQKSKLPLLGDYALVILDTLEFEKRICQALEGLDLKYELRSVQYHNNNTIEGYYCLNTIDDIPFVKRKNKFEYQQEYRLYISNKQVNDHFELQIGDIKSITKLVPTKELLEMSAIYKTIIKEKTE